TDALTYHFPAAFQWLATGRLGLLETWFFNPANTYSPLAGSTFIAWLIAPMGNDILARGVETPALGMLFFVLLQLCRVLGASVRIAAIIALAGCCSRPLINQVFLAKDDLFVAAFFGAAVVAMTKQRLQDPLGAVRLGIALGLLFATKYTALLGLPILLLMIDAPRGAGWRARQYATVLVVALVLAGPWFLRNWIIAGNPVFPIAVKIGSITIFHGMFTPARSQALRTLAGIFKTFTGYSGLPALPICVIAVLWIASIARAGTRIKNDPLERVIALGPLVMFALFLATSPYAEVRFVYPAFLMMFAGSAIAFARPPLAASQIGELESPDLRRRERKLRADTPIALLAPLALACITIATSFIPQSLILMIEPTLYALGVIALIVAAIEFRSISLSALIIAAVGVLAFVYWPSYAKQYREGEADYWTAAYGDLGPAWKFVRDDTPAGATIAYTNTSFVYPLMGAELDRQLVYAPTRAGVRTIRDLGHVDERVAGEQIVGRIAELTFHEPDRETWLDNLRARGAKYLLIAKQRVGSSPPPELKFVEEPSSFRRVFDNPAAAVYEIVQPVR
ncbi:MAG: hypothetical protein H7Z14_19295, partial [Anaerolineae bacterium]|nr:hypothetical protein [Phycisphaerae bacterium]